MSIPVTDAIAAIQRDGFYVIKDGNVGEQVLQFDQEVKSPNGFKFLAHHSLDNPVSITTIPTYNGTKSCSKFSKLFRTCSFDLGGHL